MIDQSLGAAHTIGLEPVVCMLCAGRCGGQRAVYDGTETVQLHLKGALLRCGVEVGRLDAEVSNLLAAVGLQGKQENECSRLSGGEERRLSIAAAFAGDPRVVLLDEVQRPYIVGVLVLGELLRVESTLPCK